jgi:hypothetical protein
MTYRIFDVSPRGEVHERRQHAIPVEPERRKRVTSARTQPEMSEWDKPRERLRGTGASVARTRSSRR